MHIFMSSFASNRVYYVTDDTIDSYRVGNTVILKPVIRRKNYEY